MKRLDMLFMAWLLRKPLITFRLVGDMARAPRFHFGHFYDGRWTFAGACKETTLCADGAITFDDDIVGFWYPANRRAADIPRASFRAAFRGVEARD